MESKILAHWFFSYIALLMHLALLYAPFAQVCLVISSDDRKERRRLQKSRRAHEAISGVPSSFPHILSTIAQTKDHCFSSLYMKVVLMPAAVDTHLAAARQSASNQSAPSSWWRTAPRCSGGAGPAWSQQCAEDHSKPELKWRKLGGLVLKFHNYLPWVMWVNARLA